MLNTLGNNRFVHKGSQWAVCVPTPVPHTATTGALVNMDNFYI